MNDINIQPLDQVKQEYELLFKDYQFKAQLDKASNYAEDIHSAQMRDGQNQPYYIHLLRVVICLFKEFEENDLETLQAAFLHDTLEDTAATSDEISTLFGRIVSEYVTMLTRARNENETVEQKVASKKEYYQYLMSAPLAVRKIKVADQLDNSRDYKHITIDSPIYNKIPRWMAEIINERIPLAETVNQKYVDAFKTEYDILVNKKGYKAKFSGYTI